MTVRVAALLASGLVVLTTAQAQDLRLSRWQLTSTKYYSEVTTNQPAADVRVFRFNRAAAQDDELERCANEARTEAGGGSPRSNWCRAMAASLAPAFRFVLQTKAPITIGSVDVRVLKVQTLKAGRGFYEDEAAYDIRIKPEEGTVQNVQFAKPVQFTINGTIDLRLGFDLSQYGASPKPLEIELALTFRADGGDQMVTTPRFRLQM